MTAAARALDRLGREHRHARAIAVVASLATQVEPALLRRLRLRFVPDADAGAEADLSFSGIVRFGGVDGVVFHDAAANVLREELARNPALLEQAWSEVEHAHRCLPLAIRLEEELGYRLLRDDDASRERIRVLLRAAVTALVTGADGLAHWAARALPRFPAALLNQFEEARMLHAGALTRLDTPLDAAIPGDAPLPRWLSWVTPPSTGRVRAHLRLSAARPGTATGAAITRRLELGTPAAIAAGTPLDLPATDPLGLDVISADQAGAPAHGAPADRVVATLRLSPEQDDSVSAIVPDGPLRLRTLLGEEHLLEPVNVVASRTARDIIDFSRERERHRPYFGDQLVTDIVSAVDGALTESESRSRGSWFVIDGEAGSGKTALMAALVDAFEHRQSACAHHFFRGDVPWLCDPGRAMRSLSAQIEARFPVAAVDRTPSSVPARWLQTQLMQLAEHTDERLVILLDALDEARIGGQHLANFIPEPLPPRVIVVASLRTSHRTIAPTKDGGMFSLDARNRSERLKAIGDYLRLHGVQNPKAQEWSDGNWTFASMLAAFLGGYPDARLDDSSSGHVGSLTERVLMTSGVLRLSAAVVAVAREPVPVDLAQRCLKAATSDDRSRIVRQFKGKGISPRQPAATLEMTEHDVLTIKFRQPDSGFEALTIRTPEIREAVLNSIDTLWGHRLLVKAMTGPETVTDGFARRQLLYHAAKAKDGRLVRRLTRDVVFLARRVREESVDALLEDLRMCESEISGIVHLTPVDRPPAEAIPTTKPRRPSRSKAPRTENIATPQPGGARRRELVRRSSQPKRNPRKR